MESMQRSGSVIFPLSTKKDLVIVIGLPFFFVVTFFSDTTELANSTLVFAFSNLTIPPFGRPSMSPVITNPFSGVVPVFNARFFTWEKENRGDRIKIKKTLFIIIKVGKTL